MNNNLKKLKEYIERQKARGVKDEDIKKGLLSAGWRKDDVDKMFQGGIKKASSATGTGKHTAPKKGFVYYIKRIFIAALKFIAGAIIGGFIFIYFLIDLDEDIIFYIYFGLGGAFAVAFKRFLGRFPVVYISGFAIPAQLLWLLLNSW
ncbi:MAG: hypothetical protein R3346_04745 [Candidatus Spechtbacterales bacterium]|nr:hypothetical protein [Candidatus Spechtbacterales bacterium]